MPSQLIDELTRQSDRVRDDLASVASEVSATHEAFATVLDAASEMADQGDLEAAHFTLKQQVSEQSAIEVLATALDYAVLEVAVARAKEGNFHEAFDTVDSWASSDAVKKKIHSALNANVLDVSATLIADGNSELAFFNVERFATDDVKEQMIRDLTPAFQKFVHALCKDGDFESSKTYIQAFSPTDDIRRHLLDELDQVVRDAAAEYERRGQVILASSVLTRHFGIDDLPMNDMSPIAVLEMDQRFRLNELIKHARGRDAKNMIARNPFAALAIDRALKRSTESGAVALQQAWRAGVEAGLEDFDTEMAALVGEVQIAHDAASISENLPSSNLSR